MLFELPLQPKFKILQKLGSQIWSLNLTPFFREDDY
jgi:hypothetical protein